MFASRRFSHVYHFGETILRCTLRKAGACVQEVQVHIGRPTNELRHLLGSVCWLLHSKEDLTSDLSAGTLREVVTSGVIKEVLQCFQTKVAAIELAPWQIGVDCVSDVPELA